MPLLVMVQVLAQQGVEGGVRQEVAACLEVVAVVREHLLICSFFDVARTHL